MERYSEAGDPGGEEGCSAKEGGRMIVHSTSTTAY